MRKLICILLFQIVITDCIAQLDALYIPVTINSPLFDKPTQPELGAKINNFGLNYNIAGSYKNNFLIIAFQHNNGRIEFDPMNYNIYHDQLESTHLIQTKPVSMAYIEAILGYNFIFDIRNLSLMAGFGQQFQKPNKRYFIQMDWGAEGKFSSGGISLRTNYTSVKNTKLFILEPVAQGKIWLWKFKAVAQFGYSIPLKKHQDYMKPILSLGLEFVF